MTDFVPGTVVSGFLDNGQWSASFGVSYRDLCLADAMGPQQLIRHNGKELRKICGAGGIAAGRNEVAQQFLDESDGEWLWFIDTDMSFATDTIAQLTKSADPVERPVLGALCFAVAVSEPADLYALRFKITPTMYRYIETEDLVGFAPYSEVPQDQVVEVDGTGTGCLLIHRGVLEEMREKHGDRWFDQMVHPTGDHGRPRTFSEDLSFMVRLASLGIKPHVDTAIKTAHHKGAVFLDEQEFIRQQAFDAFQLAHGAAVIRKEDDGP